MPRKQIRAFIALHIVFGFTLALLWLSESNADFSITNKTPKELRTRVTWPLESHHDPENIESEHIITQRGGHTVKVHKNQGTSHHIHSLVLNCYLRML